MVLQLYIYIYIYFIKLSLSLSLLSLKKYFIFSFFFSRSSFFTFFLFPSHFFFLSPSLPRLISPSHLQQQQVSLSHLYPHPPTSLFSLHLNLTQNKTHHQTCLQFLQNPNPQFHSQNNYNNNNSIRSFHRKRNSRNRTT